MLQTALRSEWLHLSFSSLAALPCSHCCQHFQMSSSVITDLWWNAIRYRNVPTADFPCCIRKLWLYWSRWGWLLALWCLNFCLKFETVPIATMFISKALKRYLWTHWTPEVKEALKLKKEAFQVWLAEGSVEAGIIRRRGLQSGLSWKQKLRGGRSSGRP